MRRGRRAHYAAMPLRRATSRARRRHVVRLHSRGMPQIVSSRRPLVALRPDRPRAGRAGVAHPCRADDRRRPVLHPVRAQQPAARRLELARAAAARAADRARACRSTPQAGFFVLTTVSLAITALLTWLAARERACTTSGGRWSPFRCCSGRGSSRRTCASTAWSIRWRGSSSPASGWRRSAASGGWRPSWPRSAWWPKKSSCWRRWPPPRRPGIGGDPGSRWAWPRRRIVVALLLTVLFPGSGTDAGAYLGDWVRKGLFSNGVGRAVFLLFASYGALWLLAAAGLVELCPSTCARGGRVLRGRAAAAAGRLARAHGGSHLSRGRSPRRCWPRGRGACRWSGRWPSATCCSWRASAASARLPSVAGLGGPGGRVRPGAVGLRAALRSLQRQRRSAAPALS